MEGKERGEGKRYRFVSKDELLSRLTKTQWRCCHRGKTLLLLPALLLLTGRFFVAPIKVKFDREHNFQGEQWKGEKGREG